jgi:low temperature requirement protein LtrA
VTKSGQRNLMRDRSAGRQRVTNVELFFDLVYVFAVTQLSHYLLHHRTLSGGLQAALLLAMVWLLWAYTTWLTNWLDPERIPVRCAFPAKGPWRCWSLPCSAYSRRTCRPSP